MRVSVLAMISALLSCGVSLAADAPAYYVDANGCKFVTNPPVDATPPQFRFNGQCVDGLVAGTGEVTLLDGSGARYRGEFQEGRLVKGVMDGRFGTYQGEVRDNRAHGQGTLEFSDGRVFKGRFEEGRPAGSSGEITFPTLGRFAGALDIRRLEPRGKGIMYYNNGPILVGEFMEGDKAVGTMKLADGTVAQGNFVGGVLQGAGKIEWANGTRYEGEVQASHPHGRGSMAKPNGETYDGDFVDGYYHGKGTLKTPRGDVYVGDFILGDRHGLGEIKFASGTVKSGEWMQGVLHGKCRMATPTQKYEGSCWNGLRGGGRGRWEDTAESTVYDGDFKEDLYDGKGTLRTKTPDGVEITYDGQFAQGVMDGAGVLTIGGLRFDGTFKADEFLRGKILAPDGREFEVDMQAGDVVEVLKDGSKRPLDALPADITV